MRRGQLLAGAGGLVAAALVGGTLSAAFAAQTASSGASSAPTIGGAAGEYCEVYLDTLANELGVERAALLTASKTAMTAVVDAAVEDGELDEERATDIRERIAEADEGDCAGFGRHLLGGGHRGGPGFGHGRPAFAHFGDVLEAASTALKLEQDELVAALRDGTALDELAETQGVEYETVTAAVTDAVRAELDDAVADDEITQERADEILGEVADWLEDGGEPMRVRGHGWHRP